jgi:ligand-binding sensor domain-containing protein/anti-sigma regulatory factor (Ser/Thr protein kinase)
MFKYGPSIIYLLVMFIGKQVKAQTPFNYYFKHIDQSDGLLHNQALSIAQDGRGFIWITTTNGLQRYDGLRFINYKEMISDPNEELTYTTDMYADPRKNVLWITNNIRLEKMELDNNHFTVYDAERIPKDSAFPFSQFKDGKDKSVRIGQNGIYQADGPSGEYKPIHLNVLPPQSHQSGFIATDSIHHVTWAVTATQLYEVDREKKSLYSKNANPQRHPLLDSSCYQKAGDYFRFILQDSRQNIWVSTWGNALLKYDPVTRKISYYSLASIQAREKAGRPSDAIPLINCMLEDDNHTIWIGTENAGLLRYDSAKDQFDYCISHEDDPEGIRYNYKIFSLFQDKERNIWIGTDKGINIFNPYRQYITTIRHRESDPQSIGKSELICFLQTRQGDLFLGTWGGGIVVYDSLFHFKKTIIPDGPMYKKFIWSLLQPDRDNLWIGCQAGYLLIYTLSTGVIRTLRPQEMEKSTIRCMEKDRRGNIWFGLHNGKIAEWDSKNNRFWAYGNSGKEDGPELLPSVFTMYIDPGQHCWVSTSNGFKEFDLEKRVFLHTWLPVKNDANSISGKTMEGIEPYNDSTLLLGTVFGGLNFFHTHTMTFSHLTMTEGLPSNTIYSIRKDSAGNIWFTTDYNLYRWDTKSNKAIAYRFEPGIISSTFASNHFYTLENGQWVAFTSTELISFYPGNLQREDVAGKPVIITGFRVFDKPLHIDSLLNENKPIRLAYNQNFFSIEFSALDFSDAEQINYVYKLEGINKDWVNGNSKGSASYTDLPPGTYHFWVKAGTDIRNGPAQELSILIMPPFWKTDLFKLLEGLLIASLLYALIKWRIYYVRKEAKSKMLLMKRITDMEMQALRSQMNPHFIFNCINSIDALIQSNDKYHATVYLNKFAKLLRNILDSSKQNTVTLGKDLETLKLYIELEQLRHENKFSAEFIAGDELLSEDYKVPPLIIQPFVENAILHGIRYRPDNRGLLTIKVFRENDYLKFTILDNGVGRHAATGESRADKPSYGIGLSKDRVKLFNNEDNASVEIIDLMENGHPSGTKVELRLKIQ